MASKTPVLSSPSSRASLRSLKSPKKSGSEKNETPASPLVSSNVASPDLEGSALRGFVETGSAAVIEENMHVILGDGRYQIRVLVTAALAAAMMLTQALANELISRPVDHWCRPPDNMRHLPAHVWRNAAIPVDADGGFSKCTVYDPPIAVSAKMKPNMICGMSTRPK
ncbi:hypothetical protein HPB49_025089 [Dermacentor silvarum]|uniref:Uncharacterized protein n=1 Tax=Dermacentor silvarum TaxID=543639 RepID=A0ACB8DGR0_DERSI|nr:hypothetical protein HPB49_025089 [Dermacentor silvarum]